MPLPPLYEMLCMQKFCQGVGENLGVLKEGVQLQSSLGGGSAGRRCGIP